MGAGINSFKIAAAVITLMLLFPPYKCIHQSGRVMDSGYGFIFNLPSYTLTYSGSFNSMVTMNIPASIDHATLIVQIVVALVVAVLSRKK